MWGPEGGDARSLQLVHQAIGQGLLGSHDHKVNVQPLGGLHYARHVLRRQRQVGGKLGGPKIAAGHPYTGDLRALTQAPGEGVLPAARSYYQDFQLTCAHLAFPLNRPINSTAGA